METLSMVLRYEMLFLLIGLMVIVAYRLLTQKINVKGLLMDKTGGRAFSPGRLQMLIVTISIAAYYVLMVIEAKDAGKFPDMPNEFLLALGGSHTIYLGGKLYGRFASALGLASPLMKERSKPERWAALTSLTSAENSTEDSQAHSDSPDH